MNNFYIRFTKEEGGASEIQYRYGKRTFPNHAPAIEAEQKDRKIVTILRKYLDMELNAGQKSVLDDKDFTILGELLAGLVFMDKNLRNDFEEWYTEVINEDKKADSYNIFVEFDFSKEFGDLAILPWEYIYFTPYDPKKKFKEPFLAAGIKNRVNFYRQLPIKIANSFDEEFFSLEPPLKILVIISNPIDHKVQKLKDLLEYFCELKKRYPGNEQLEIRYLYNPGIETTEFQRELNLGHPDGKRDLSEINEFKEFLNGIGRHNDTFSPDIVHYVGHGNVVNNTGKLSFAKEVENYGNTDYFEKEIDDKTFAFCISESRLDPKLVFLQVCNGGRVVNYEERKGTAICLLEKEVPFVIAMQNPVQEDHALLFTKTFYNTFLEGENIGSCVSHGRYKLGGQGAFNHKAFGSPVLFTLTHIPLSFKTAKRRQQPAGEPLAEPAEQIFKYCNTPGCPYFGRINLYSAIDEKCGNGHSLVSIKTGAVSDGDSSQPSEQYESSMPNSAYQNQPANSSSSTGIAGAQGKMNQRDGGTRGGAQQTFETE